MTVFIYSLIDPFSQEVRYVGKSNKPKTRFATHIKNAKTSKRKTHCYAWINSLLKLNVLPILEILEEVDIKSWEEKEIFWISQFDNLTNMIDGGKYSPMEHPECIEKMRKSLTGKKHSVERVKATTERTKLMWKKGILKPGYKHSQAFKDNKSKESKTLWDSYTIEEKQARILKSVVRKYKQIEQYTTNNILIKTWPSIQEAELIFYKQSKGQIMNLMRKNGIAKGFIWKYKEAEIPEIKNPLLN